MTAAFSWFWDSEGWGLEPTIAWEYTAEFHGPIGLMHWRQDTYSHNHIVAIDAISNPI